jgi:class 3 adenylate cyclase/tetratricopeptide (TPR) repeat protein
VVESVRNELEKLNDAAAGLESQRALLGDAIIQPALDSLYEKIASLERQQKIQQITPEERRIVTILFADIVGSTSLASQIDPEEWREIISAVHFQGGAHIERYNGSILQFLGDGLLAVFGLQNASEKDPDNAVRAALTIQADLPNLISSHQSGMASGLQMRIGIHTGLVVIGELGSETKRELTATGDAMNVAAHLQSAAPAGGILISHNTFSYLRQSFEVQLQLPLIIKGKTEPLRTYLVLRAQPTGFSTMTRGVAGIEVTTIGRTKELNHLHNAYNEVLEQHSVQWLQIIGEAGVGKSRLLAEMRSYFPQRIQNYQLFKCRAYPGDEHQAYIIAQRMWMDFFQLPEDAPAGEIETLWLAAIRDLMPINQDETWLVESASILGFLLGMTLTQSSPYVDQPTQLKNLGLLVSRQLFSSICRSAPVVLLLEDAQWLDQASLGYLCDLFLEPGENQGILILATCRQEWKPASDLKNHPAFHELIVPPLTPAACNQLTHALLKNVDGIPEQVIQRISQRAEGIPYFIEEMVNWLLDLGVIDQGQQPWKFAVEKYNPSLLPDTLQHLLQTRLDNLDSEGKTILQYGAVLGRRFWEGWLEAQFVLPSRDALLALQSRGFITKKARSAFEGETEWRFFHQVQQEVAYASLLKRKRRELHHAAADWLEHQAIKADRLDEFAGTIGKHALEAGDQQKACEWYFRAGEHARQRGALVEARLNFERALHQLPEQNLEGRWPILLALDEVLGFQADTQARLAEDELLVSFAQQTGRKDYLAEAYDRQGNYLFYRGDIQMAAGLLKQAYQNALIANKTEIACRSSSMLAISLARLGEREEAHRWAEQVPELTKQCQDDLTMAKVMNNLSFYYSMLGDHYQSAQMNNKQVQLTRKIKHRLGEAKGLGNLSYSYILLGLYSIGIVTLLRALELDNAYGMNQDAAYTQLNLGLAYMRINDFPSSRHELETAMMRLTRIQDQFGLSSGKLYLGLAHEQHTDPSTARDLFEQAERIFTEISVPGSGMDCRAGLARCALKLGDLELAQRLAQELWVYLQQNQTVGMEFPILAYQTCAITFEQCAQQQQKAEALHLGYAMLMDNARRISEPNWRQVYLHQIPEHDWMFNQTKIVETTDE